MQLGAQKKRANTQRNFGARGIDREDVMRWQASHDHSLVRPPARTYAPPINNTNKEARSNPEASKT